MDNVNTCESDKEASVYILYNLRLKRRSKECGRS